MSAYVGLWCGLHLQVARLTDTPEIAITEADGKAFLTAVQNVARHYPITATQKTIDWAALIFTAGFIYVPRAMAVRARLAERGRAGTPLNAFNGNPMPPQTAPQPPVFQFVPNPTQQPSPPVQAPQPPQQPGPGTPTNAFVGNPPAPDMTYEPDLAEAA